MTEIDWTADPVARLTQVAKRVFELSWVCNPNGWPDIDRCECPMEFENLLWSLDATGDEVLALGKDERPRWLRDEGSGDLREAVITAARHVAESVTARQQKVAAAVLKQAVDAYINGGEPLHRRLRDEGRCGTPDERYEG